jgi:hypothetical protein
MSFTGDNTLLSSMTSMEEAAPAAADEGATPVTDWSEMGMDTPMNDEGMPPPADDQPAEQAAPQPDGPPPWYAQQPAVNPQPPPYLQQQMAPPPPSQALVPGFNQVNWDLLNPQSVQMRETQIKASFEGPYARAVSDAERAAVEQEYKSAVLYHRMEVTHVQLAKYEADLRAREQQMQAISLPLLRAQSAARIANELQLDINDVLYDDQGYEVHDPKIMRLLAETKARYRHQGAVRTRTERGVDTPYRATGGQQPTSIWSMSDKQFAQHKERLRQRYGNR